MVRALYPNSRSLLSKGSSLPSAPASKDEGRPFDRSARTEGAKVEGRSLACPAALSYASRGSTGRGRPASSTATKVMIASVTLAAASPLRSRLQASTAMRMELRPIRSSRV